MVGFGSSLRMARRPGWEEAYFNYEALKLLLTQIEAVYEEEAHLQQYRLQHGGGGGGGLDDLRDLDVMFMETPDRRGHNNNANNSNKRRPSSAAPPLGGDDNDGGGASGGEKVRDYRDDLFLESDSDAAFESLMKYDAYSAEEEASDLEQQQQQYDYEQQLSTMQHPQQYSPNGGNRNNYGGGGYPNIGGGSSGDQQSNQQQQLKQQLQHSRSDSGGNNGITATTTGLSFSSFAAASSSQDHHHHHHHHHHHNNNNTNTSMTTEFGGNFASSDNYDTNHRFDSHQRHHDSSDDSDSQDDNHNNCVPSFGRLSSKSKKKNGNNNATKANNNNNKLPKASHYRSNKNKNGGSRGSFLSPTKGEPEHFFVTTTEAGSLNNNNSNMRNDGFILEATDNTQSQNGNHNDNDNTNYDYEYRNNETTSLLPMVPASPGDGSPLYSFASHTGPGTPPPESGFHNSKATIAGNQQQPQPAGLFMPNIATNMRANATAIASSIRPPASSNKSKLMKQVEEERKVERRKRRQKKRKRAQQRHALERKVPQHIRRAHAKARQITERFLGLLRAECEKVMLFAQSRLGELADTAGSLRFPAMEDHHHHHHSHHSHHHHNQHHHYNQHPMSNSSLHETVPLSPTASRGTAGSYDYPLSDGGMHPSASSSSDDGAGDSGLFYWSDSSSDSANSNNSGAKNLSAFRDMQDGRPSHHQHRKTGSDNNMHHRVPSSSGKQHDGFKSAKRHLDHFEKIRRNRPIFQRNGNIMGEDLLLLSAVDEADGYTAVGVELMHVLRFISVNLIAVRKICRKHDRLLMNRMLGGYYHHQKMLAASESNSKWSAQDKRDHLANRKRPQSYQDEHLQNAQTLGGLLARESGDIFETHHPAVIGQVNNYKLVGLYDANLQQLANSRTVQVISSCLVLALSEYEVSRSRANALATLNTNSGAPIPRRGSGHRQQLDKLSAMVGGNPRAHMEPLNETDEFDGMDSDDEGGAPSTASSISLTRLRFAVTSIIALREAARRKKDMYSTYLSRSMLAFTGRAVVGEGLDGCSRETLDFFVTYNPDAALLMDPASLSDGLKQGMWSKRSISSIMASSLAVASTPVELNYELTAKTVHQREITVTRAVNLLPKFKFVEVPDLFKGQRAKKTITGLAVFENDCFRSILRINRGSHLLYTMNYFIVHPTTITFVGAIGSPGAHSALVIGAPSLAALLSALFHCYVLSGDSKAPLANVSSLRWLFVLASIFGVIGNAVHVYGVWEDSISYAIFGRFIMGFSCSEILHRNVVAGFLPVHRMVTETAILVQMQVFGMLLGFVIGTFSEFLPFHIVGWGIRSLSSSSWLMGVFWFVHLVHVSIGFKVEDGEAKQRLEANNVAEVEQLLTKSKPPLAATNNPDSDSSGSMHGKGKDSAHHLRSSLRLTYGATDDDDDDDAQPDTNDNTAEQVAPIPRKKKPKRGKGRKRRMRTLKSFPSRLRSLLNYSIAVPVCLFILLYTKFAFEVLVSSCPMIVNRYFRWGGGRAGIFLAALTLTVLPMNFICGHIARKYEERTVIKKSLLVLGTGLIVMINYGSFVELAFQIRELMSETDERQRGTQYDWLLGIAQYFVGFGVTFLGLTSLDSATLSLLSKVSPPRIRTSSTSLQLGTIVSFVTLFARVIADFQILMIGLSHRLINTDLVNSLVLPLLVACYVIGHFIRKHFFFLL